MNECLELFYIIFSESQGYSCLKRQLNVFVYNSFNIYNENVNILLYSADPSISHLGTCSLCSAEQGLLQVTFASPPPSRCLVPQSRIIFPWFSDRFQSQNPLSNIPCTT